MALLDSSARHRNCAMIGMAVASVSNSGLSAVCPSGITLAAKTHCEHWFARRGAVSWASAASSGNPPARPLPGAA